MNLEGLTENRSQKGTVYYVDERTVIVAKECASCNKILALNNFSKHITGVGGKRPNCKGCISELEGVQRRKEGRRINKKSELEIVDGVTGKKCSQCGKWTVLDNYHIKKKGLGGRESRCKLCRSECLRYWAQTNRDKRRLTKKRRIARKKNLPDTLTIEQYSITLEYFGNACALTGRTDNLEKEHAIPQSMGGGFTFENIYPMTKSLNCSKYNHNIFEWFEANRQRFNLEQERFDRLIEWLGKANGMTVEEYRAYVYECHANPNVIDDAKAN